MFKIIPPPIDLQDNSPLAFLYPLSYQRHGYSGISECLLYQGKHYLLRLSSAPVDSFLCIDSVSEAFCYIRDVYNWDDIFHPFDCFAWEEAFQFFAQGDFFSSTIFQFNSRQIIEVYHQLKQQSLAVRELVKSGQIDVRLPGFCLKNGFVLDGFFVYIFQKGRFSYQMQMLIVDAFSRFFRRQKLTSEKFMSDNQSVLDNYLVARTPFLDWLRSVTSPIVYQHSKRRDELCAAICAGQKMQLRRDMSLEEDWLDLYFRFEDRADIERLIQLLSEPQRQRLFSEFWDNTSV